MNIILFHGSTQIVETPLVIKGRDNLDFGKGFYLTSYREQAQQWALRLKTLRHAKTVWVNEYTFDLEKALSMGFKRLQMPTYNEEWLNFIAASRHGEQPWLGFDIIEGGVANDKVVDAVEAYIAGLADVDHTLNKLSYAKPNNQICLLNQSLIDSCLTFQAAYEIKEALYE